ncbi:MAG: hypothetical protein ACRYG2_10230, partial [Janthinobacterium lividum]
MNKSLLGLGTLAAAAALTLAGCGGGGSTGGQPAASGSAAAVTGKIGVILPDTQSSARWENADRPFFTKAFGDAGVQVDIQNAQGDATQFQTIADGMISAGDKAIIMTSIDPDSGN